MIEKSELSSLKNEWRLKERVKGEAVKTFSKNIEQFRNLHNLIISFFPQTFFFLSRGQVHPEIGDERGQRGESPSVGSKIETRQNPFFLDSPSLPQTSKFPASLRKQDELPKKSLPVRLSDEAQIDEEKGPSPRPSPQPLFHC